MSLQLLIDNFQLVEDPKYDKFKKVARPFDKDRLYTTQEIFHKLEKRYRRGRDGRWVETVNKLFDGMLYYELMIQENGYFKFV